MKINKSNMGTDPNEDQFINWNETEREDFQHKILTWYKGFRREMPWREEPSPYRIWISEIMLQQTRVDTVIPYFNNFMEKYPTIESLASSDEDELMKYWEGLGYYSRIRNIRETAINIMSNYNGQIPETYDELIKLKGIGEYTAGAIASEAFGQKVPAVDGNVFRVFARLTAKEEDLRDLKFQKKLKEAVKSVLPETEVGDFNQGLIELGALICIPKGSPKCGLCPVKDLCLSNKLNLQDKIPFKSKAKERVIQEKTVFILQYEDKFAVRKRDDQNLLAGLFEIPNVEGFYTLDEARTVVEEMGFVVSDLHMIKDRKVVFTHIEWILQGYYVHVQNENERFIFDTKENLEQNYTLATAFRTYLNFMEGPQQLSLDF
ncbi:MAG: A/G-specific adenine glycosylase [Clostridiaceae bacterium]